MIRAIRDGVEFGCMVIVGLAVAMVGALAVLWILSCLHWIGHSK